MEVEATSHFYCVILDYESCLLTRFKNSLFRHYHFLHLCFVIVCFFFNTRCTRSFNSLRWHTNSITDDFHIHDHDEAEHDTCLCHFMTTTLEHELILNAEKCQMMQVSITFFNCVHDIADHHLDPTKVATICNIPQPTNIVKLQEFLGMMTYLPYHHHWQAELNFMSFGIKMLILQWSSVCQTVFQCVKELINADIIMHYYDVNWHVTMQMVALNHSLGQHSSVKVKP